MILLALAALIWIAGGFVLLAGLLATAVWALRGEVEGPVDDRVGSEHARRPRPEDPPLAAQGC